MMMSSQLTALTLNAFTTELRTKALFFGATAKVAWTNLWSNVPALWLVRKLHVPFGKKDQYIMFFLVNNLFNDTHFVWQVGDPSAQLRWTPKVNLKHRRVCWSFPSSFCHHRHPSHPIPRRPSDFGEAAWKNCRSVWTKIEQNAVDSLCCWTESCCGDVPNPVGSSRFLLVPIFMHQQSYPLRLFLLDSAHVNHATLAQLRSFFVQFESNASIPA